MFVKLTLVNGGHDVFLHAGIVTSIERNPQNPLETVIVTNMITPKGPRIYVVKESPLDAAILVDGALHGGQLSIVTRH